MKTTLKKIATLLEGFNYAIGGSISLLADGIINRQPKDIDIVLDRAALARLAWSGELLESPTYTDHDWHLRFMDEEHFICCFVHDDVKNTPKTHKEWLGIRLPMQHPHCTIQAKEEIIRQWYAQPPLSPEQKRQAEKHIKDIEAWEHRTSKM